MKKIIVGALLCAFMFSPVTMTPVQAKDDGAAAILSLVFPGAGEWYNSGWNGSFPWGECIVGSICFFFRYSSVMDAANGNSDNGSMRLDFWSAPQ